MLFNKKPIRNIAFQLCWNASLCSLNREKPLLIFFPIFLCLWPQTEGVWRGSFHHQWVKTGPGCWTCIQARTKPCMYVGWGVGGSGRDASSISWGLFLCVYPLKNTRVIFIFLYSPEGKYAALQETFLPLHSRRLRGRVASADGNAANRWMNKTETIKIDSNSWGKQMGCTTEGAELPFYVQKVSNLMCFVPVLTEMRPLDVHNRRSPASSEAESGKESWPVKPAAFWTHWVMFFFFFICFVIVIQSNSPEVKNHAVKTALMLT